MDKRPFKKEEEENEEEDTGTESEDFDGDGVEEEEEVGVSRKRVMIRVYSGHQRSGISLGNCSSICASGSLCCQADECGVDLRVAKMYHRRHKVCERHAKAPVVLVSGIRQRFCQQCSRFHEISQFDDTKRSCRERLAGHNERRRKTHSDQQAEDGKQPTSKMSSNSLKVESHPKYGEMTLQGSPNTKHFRIR